MTFISISIHHDIDIFPFHHHYFKIHLFLATTYQVVGPNTSPGPTTA
jgi:hypothetical protein